MPVLSVVIQEIEKTLPWEDFSKNQNIGCMILFFLFLLTEKMEAVFFLLHAFSVLNQSVGV
jgi:hypothetical protein